MKNFVFLLEIILFNIFLSYISAIQAQVLPKERYRTWYNAGLVGSQVPSYSNQINVMDFGAVADGTVECDNALSLAQLALNNKPGVLFFPEGKYLFTKSIRLTDSMVMRGVGAGKTVLIFNPTVAKDFIIIEGKIEPVRVSLQGTSLKGDFQIRTQEILSNFKSNFIFIRQKDDHLMFSTWAYGSFSQIGRIRYSFENNIVLHEALRKNFNEEDSSYFQFIKMRSGVGLECLTINRLDETPSAQTKNVQINYASDCWIKGVESDSCNFAHVNISNSYHIEISGCFFHGAFNYGDGGKAFGVVCESGSGDCLIENNIFKHLRHSMLSQSGSNGNVWAYNYSLDPFWTSNPLYPNISGDIVLHGNLPYSNLFEGNIISHIWIDNSHGLNGSNNTFFRNRPYVFGIHMSNASSEQNFVGNEIPTNMLIPLLGNSYTLLGNSHFEYGNRLVDMIIPLGTNQLKDTSYYLHSTPYFWVMDRVFPSIGLPIDSRQNSNVAFERYHLGQETTCDHRSSNFPVQYAKWKKSRTRNGSVNLQVEMNCLEPVACFLLRRKMDKQETVIDSVYNFPTNQFHYYFLDDKTWSGEIMYRIEWIKLNGEAQFSEWVKIPANKKMLDPQKEISERGAEGKELIKYRIFDLNGRLLEYGVTLNPQHITCQAYRGMVMLSIENIEGIPIKTMLKCLPE